MTQSNIEIVQVNYQHRAQVKERLLKDLPAQSNIFSLLVRVDGKGVGFCNCLWGYSTFAAQPLVNIHDLGVVTDCRGQGLSQVLLQAVVDIAKQGGAVKVTLEVLGNNAIAQGAYRRFGFAPYELTENAGRAEFWQYYLDTSCSGS